MWRSPCLLLLPLLRLCRPPFPPDLTYMHATTLPPHTATDLSFTRYGEYSVPLICKFDDAYDQNLPMKIRPNTHSLHCDSFIAVVWLFFFFFDRGCKLIKTIRLIENQTRLSMSCKFRRRDDFFFRVKLLIGLRWSVTKINIFLPLFKIMGNAPSQTEHIIATLEKQMQKKFNVYVFFVLFHLESRRRCILLHETLQGASFFLIMIKASLCLNDCIWISGSAPLSFPWQGAV